MKNTMKRLWSMTLMAVAYFCAFIGTVIGIPGRLLYDIGEGLSACYEKLILKAAVDNGYILDEDDTFEDNE